MRIKRQVNSDADTIDQAVEEPTRVPRGMARVIRALRAETYPMDIANVDYAVGDMEVEKGPHSYVPVRELTDFLMQDTYDDPESLIDDLQKIARGANILEMPRPKKLSERVCTPCRKGTPTLDSRQAHELLVQLGNGWSFTDDGHLHKIFRFKDFVTPMEFANRITRIAEDSEHHPDLHISWGKCVVELWTHAINGLTENDFILAAKIEAAS